MTPALQQRMSALAKAQMVRTENRKLKARVGSLSRSEAEVLVAAVIRFPIDHEEALRLDQLLESIHGVGGVRVTWYSRDLPLKPHQKLRDIPKEWRDVVAARLKPAPLPAKTLSVQQMALLRIACDAGQVRAWDGYAGGVSVSRGAARCSLSRMAKQGWLNAGECDEWGRVYRPSAKGAALLARVGA